MQELSSIFLCINKAFDVRDSIISDIGIIVTEVIRGGTVKADVTCDCNFMHNLFVVLFFIKIV